ncbi:putative glutathione transferase [Microsporum canis]|uniref:glutathione transferase n=1 Tax=Arthroderma otae (strain ATCC MYA-4605 / CBS 113480) TaxID=554155 RepID=C5FKB9_ARTOC|nr:glutathione S-transferase 3 [Microsporum canis CBS 113480]EEQ30141.1 glutathione S-transferase 3 [Microsporum canis CBS 113480]
MPQFTFYAHPIATAPDRVQLAVDEAGFTDYERIDIDMGAKEQKSPEYLARNPFGKVPVIVTSDGITMYESRGIARYLCTRYNFDLLPDPKDNAAVALFEQEISCEAAFFDRPASAIIYESAIKPLLGMEISQAAVDENRKTLGEYLDVAEAIFSKTGKKFWAGDKYTLVDVYYIPQLGRIFERGHGDLITSRPALKAWWERCMARPAAKAFVDRVPKMDEVIAQWKKKESEAK